MTTHQPGFVVVTEVRLLEAIAEPEQKEREEPVYEPSRKDIWVLLGCWAVSMFVAFFFAYGVWKAVEQVLQKVGLGG